MWLGLQIVPSLERCPLFRVSFIERFHCSSAPCASATVLFTVMAKRAMLQYTYGLDY